jgi:hypothetical protein
MVVVLASGIAAAQGHGPGWVLTYVHGDGDVVSTKFGGVGYGE